MFCYEHTVSGKMDFGEVWLRYADVSRWPEWDLDMESVTLDGSFASGTPGTMFMKGMPPLPFKLDEVEVGISFVSSTVLGDAVVQFGHFIIDEGNGEYTLKHTVTITGGDEAQVQGMGRGITASIPANMENLYRLAKVG
jgi:hypothetical protein